MVGLQAGSTKSFNRERTCLCSVILDRVKVRDLIRLLERNGWRLVRTKGSHRQFRHPALSGTVTVAGKRNAEIPPGTLRSALRQAGLKEDE